jgi:F-type H+-transporting ATPase subunit gamma
MIQSLRNLKARIRSIENTKKITRAMEMVSSSKFNRAKTALFAHLPYFTKLEAIVNHLLVSVDIPSHPYLEKRPENLPVVLCLITSDTGLCSTYNVSAIRMAEKFVAKYGAEKVILITIGREGYKHFRDEKIRIAATHLDRHGRLTNELAKTVTAQLLGFFMRKEAKEVYIAYTHFGGVLRHKPILQKILEIEVPNEPVLEYLFEPDMKMIFHKILPRYITEKIRHIMLDAFTSEHASRMVAMKTAKDNATELIDTLTLLRNKARQAAITKEIIDIAMSAEALKG